MNTQSTFSFAQGNLRKLMYIPLYIVGYLLSWVVPRKPGSWAVGSGIGLGEGALALVTELKRRDPDAPITWIADTELERDVARALGWHAELRSSFAGFWATLTAHTLVVTHGLGDVQRFAVFRARIIHLWHGAPIKKLHLDSKVTTELATDGIVRRLLTGMYRSGAQQVDLYVAGSEVAAGRLRSAFQVLPGKVRIFGDPRLDPLIEALGDAQTLASQRTEISDLLELTAAQHQRRWVLYAPTWRDGQPNAGIPSEAEAVRIAAWARANDIQLFVRSHPLGAGDYAHMLGESISQLGPQVLHDITPYLGVFDSVITDYSSIAIDFSLTGRPILWFAPDLEQYAADRGLYEPYEVTTEGHYAETWDELIERGTQILDGLSGASRAARLRTGRLLTRFHAWPRGGSAARVLDYLERLDEPTLNLETRDAVFFESFYGTMATCNPLALDREIARRFPDTARYWSVMNESVAVPHGATALLVGSPEWEAVRRTVPLLIVNDWLRFNYRRRRHQFVLQTWHGTPLKRLALDRPHQPLRTRLAIRRESRRWDALITQNPQATEWLVRSYRFTGEVLEVGYPRNDRLAMASHEGERLLTPCTTARRRLGLPKERNIVLYAPTWRDRQRTQTVDVLNVAQLAEDLGDEWIILARGHSRDASFAHYSGSRVVDVTRYGDVNDLILAADVFITDYSSLMFDVSAASVPTILFTPDYEHYASAERGFTFDIRATPPGPVLISYGDVVEHLHAFAQHSTDADWIDAGEPARVAWRTRWNRLDDGSASARVVDALTERGILGSNRAGAVHGLR